MSTLAQTTAAARAGIVAEEVLTTTDFQDSEDTLRWLASGESSRIPSRQTRDTWVTDNPET